MSQWDKNVLEKNWNLITKNTKTSISLAQKDIKSSFGGEGLIYLKNNTIYKIYPNTKLLPPEKKLIELQELKHPNIIAPTDLLLDKNTNALQGFSMPYKDAYELCMLFPKAFKDRHKISPNQITNLVKLMQDANKYLHDKNYLMVDGNEMNYLVDKKFKNIYLIDVNSYQTPSYPAQAIMESIKDPHANSFDKNTDWYAWAIVTFQMFIGIHPYKGIYTKNMTMAERMKENISVFNPDVTIPAVCAPFNIIPNALLEWYESVFENGLRAAPPDSYDSKVIIHSNVVKQVGSDNFDITLLNTYENSVIAYLNGYTLTENGVYKQDRLMLKLCEAAEIITTPQNITLLARLQNSKLKLFSLLNKTEIPTQFQADEIMSHQGALYLRNGGSINLIEFVNLGDKLTPVMQKVGNVVENHCRMFTGCVISNLYNTSSVSIFPTPGKCYQIQIPELSDHKVVDAKFDKNVLIVIALSQSGDHDKFIFRFDLAFKNYDIRIQKSVQVYDINFVTLDTGVVLHMQDNGVLECFKTSMGSKDIIEVDDQSIDTDCILMNDKKQAMFARGQNIYKFSMRQAVVSKNKTKSGKNRAVRDKKTGKIIDVAKTIKGLKNKDATFQAIYDDDILIKAIMCEQI